MRRLGLTISLLIISNVAVAKDPTVRSMYTDTLIARVPELLADYDASTGRFGKGIWICTDQNAMYPLAAAYSLNMAGNKHYHDKQLLETLMKAGDALIADADADGKWVFRKKDGSTWGKIWMPWTYSRWIRTFSLIKDDMPPERRVAWEKALTHAYAGISKSELNRVHNIPTHHAMGLYIAGKALDKPEWCRQAAEFIKKVIDTQSEGGYWSEGEGPVVAYNFVYVDAIGTYHAASQDPSVLPALEKAAAYHRHFTYPNGDNVETVDQRNPYHHGVAPGNVGFTFSAVGRAYLRSQWARMDSKEMTPDLMASLILYGQDQPLDRTASQPADEWFVLKEKGVDRAATLQRGPWFICLSAITTPVSDSRWIQDRQNFLSIYHDALGLIVGGGNTKLQPGWSNFAFGDLGLLKHTPGDTNPRFAPKGELFHVPSRATLVREPLPGLDLKYGPADCRIRLEIKDERTIELGLFSENASKLPGFAHLVLLPRMGATVAAASSTTTVLSEKPIEWPAGQLGGGLKYAGLKFRLPDNASLHWPVLPHNPYVKDGAAKSIDEARLVIRMPFNESPQEHRIIMRVE